MGRRNTSSKVSTYRNGAHTAFADLFQQLVRPKAPADPSCRRRGDQQAGGVDGNWLLKGDPVFVVGSQERLNFAAQGILGRASGIQETCSRPWIQFKRGLQNFFNFDHFNWTATVPVPKLPVTRQIRH